jgi:predicted lactoylglutathione lyase
VTPVGVPAHLSLVTLGVTDLARSLAFYRAIGWEPSGGVEGEVAFFQLGNIAVALWGVTDLAADARVAPRTSTEFRGVSIAINAQSAAGVDRMYDAFMSAGATALKPPQSTDWGGYLGYVADPDGHVWEVAYNPGNPEWAAPDSG